MMVHRFKAKLRFWLGVYLLMLAGFDARTAGAESRPQLLEHSWTVGNESRWQMIHALLETRDGYLWIGTNRGLIRFDGVRFTDFLAANTPGMAQGSTAIGGLWEDRRGDLWAGTDFNEIISVPAVLGFQIGAPASVPEPASLPIMVTAGLLMVLFGRAERWRSR